MEYKMKDTLTIANIATKDITEYLINRNYILEVVNVENNKYCQNKDIDLVIIDKHFIASTIEIKGDTYHTTGNYFFETVSNTNKNTEGCFLYTEAKFLFYYFVLIRELHILNTKHVRAWFLNNINRFPSSFTRTVVNQSSYNTEGKLVPIHIVKREIGNTIIKI